MSDGTRESPLASIVSQAVRFTRRAISNYTRYGLPLLTKEMIEQSARKRTYVIRALYLAALFVGAGLVFAEQAWYAYRYNPMAILGMGRDLFYGLVMCQFMGIYVFVPLMASGLITSEKERDSLGLLLLTRLSPGTIVLEKLLGRLVPMWYLFFAALPGFALAYSLGGVSLPMLASAEWTLSITAFHCCAIAVLCSTWCRTTVPAFFTTLFVGFVIIAGPPFLEEMRIVDFPRWRVFGSSGRIEWFMMGPYLFFEEAERHGFWTCLLTSIPLVASGIACVVAARFALIPRAFVAKSNMLMNGFRATDRFLRRQLPASVSQRLLRDTSGLPGDRPIQWRETTKSISGSTRYQLYLFALVEIPLALVCIAILAEHDGGPQFYSWRVMEYFALLHFGWWILATLIVAVKAASLFSLERSQQTFDILMTTPMSTRSVLSQKMTSVTQLIRLLLLMFFTLLIFETFFRIEVSNYTPSSGYNPVGNFRAAIYVCCHALTAMIYLPMIAWMSVTLGLRIRSHAKAIFTSVLVLVAWCILPFAILAPFFITRMLKESESIWLLMLSPATIIGFNEFHELRDLSDTQWPAVIGNTLFYGLIYLAFRTWCLASADRAVGRLTGPSAVQ
jgi:hypothetical protein